MKSLDDIIKQEKSIITRHPYLADVEFRPVRDSGLSFRNIAEFMDVSWKDTYSGRERFLYPESYLRWAYGPEGLGSDYSLCAYKNEVLVGFELFTSRTIYYQRKRIDTGIYSCLSVLPGAKNNGLGQMMFIQAQKRACGKLPFLLIWFHKQTNPDINHSSYRIHKQTNPDMIACGDFNIRARVFDYDRAVSNADFYRHEKICLRLLSGKPRKPGSRVEPVTRDNLEEVLEFVNSQAMAAGGRVFTPEEFAGYCLFKNDCFQSLGLITRKDGRVSSCMVGYPLQVEYNHVDAVFFADMYVAPEAGVFPGMEGFIREIYDVYGIITICPDLGLKNLFLPTRNVLALNCIEFSQTLGQVQGLIVDHK